MAALFAGIGGLELGLDRAGLQTKLMAEFWDPARAVLAHRWPEATLAGDVRELKSLPKTDVVTAGFPCTDLSQAGRMAGIAGPGSGLVGEVFRLLRRSRPTWLVLENVRNMLVLNNGQAMRLLVTELEALGFRWAYRLVDSRCVGVPQRRQRVIFVASRTEDPTSVLFADDAQEPETGYFREDAFGFYWTEGLKGLGWAQDAVPTLKGGSTVGIPSPPAIWMPGAAVGRKLVTPTVEHAEQLQGFPAGWTSAAQSIDKRNGPRWKLVGNAVTVGVSQWLGGRLVNPGQAPLDMDRIHDGDRWPLAAHGGKGQRFRVHATLWPIRTEYQHLLDVVDPEACLPLSQRATAGFLERAERGSLRFHSDFLRDVKEHLASELERVA